MSKKLTTFIILLMSLALIGLITIQFQWIRQAFKKEKTAFTENLNQALESFTHKINSPGLTHIVGDNGDDFFFIQGPKGQNITIHHKDSSKGNINTQSEWLGVDSGLIIDSLVEDLLSEERTEIKIKIDGDQDKRNFLQRKTIVIKKDNKGNKEVKKTAFVIEDGENTGGTIQFSQQASMKKGIWSTKDNAILTLVMDLRISESQKDKVPALLTQSLNNVGIFQDFESKFIPFDEYQESEDLDHFFPELNGQIFVSPIRNFQNFKTPDYLLLSFPALNFSLWKSMIPTLILTIFFLSLTLFCFSYAILALNKQKKINILKTDFINNMTHELKTPISSISLATEALKDPEFLSNPERSGRFLDIIRDENDRLRLQVEKVLEFARAESQTFQLKTEKLSLNAIIEEEALRIQDRIKNNSGKLVLDLEDEIPFLQADVFHLKGVIFNLLDNGLKYGGNPLILTIKSWRTKNELCFSVNDNGAGIPSSEKERIFEKFYRVSTGNVHDVKGMGIGLSYCKTVINHHNGKITVSSDKSTGTTFTITFPTPKMQAGHDNILS